MTSFNAQETSRAEGRPIELYFFRYGPEPDDYLSYTDAEKSVKATFDPDLGPVIFTATPIQHSEITVSGSLDKATITVNMPETSDLTDMFMESPPSQEVTLDIWEVHLNDGAVDDAELSLAWSGRVLGHSGEGVEAVYTCEPVSTSLKRPGLTRNYQVHCPLVLYGGDCRADIAAATITVNAAGVDGPLLSLGSGWASDDLKPKYASGMAIWVRADGRTERRTIINLLSGNDTLTLSGAATGLTPGMAVQLVLGCDHTMADCRDLHSNIQNYGGQAFIPNSNPFGVKNIFY